MKLKIEEEEMSIVNICISFGIHWSKPLDWCHSNRDTDLVAGVCGRRCDVAGDVLESKQEAVDYCVWPDMTFERR